MTREETVKAFVQAMKGTPWMGEQANADLTIWTPPADAPLHRHMEFVGRVAEALGDGWSLWNVYFTQPDEMHVGFSRGPRGASHHMNGPSASDPSWAAMRAAIAAKGAKS